MSWNHYDSSGGLKIGSSTPVGALFAFAGGDLAVPAGYRLCNGDSVSRTTYSQLFAVVGTTYGAPDGSTFNLPDLRGRIPVGAGLGVDNGTGNSAAGSAPSGTTMTSRTRGAWGGKEGVLLTAAQSGTAAHGHPLSGSVSSESAHQHSTPNHSHSVGSGSGNTSVDGSHDHSGEFTNTENTGSIPNPANINAGDTTGRVTRTINSSAGSGSHNHTVVIDSSGGGTTTGASHTHSNTFSVDPATSAPADFSHENTQPFIVTNYIIKF